MNDLFSIDKIEVQYIKRDGGVSWCVIVDDNQVIATGWQYNSQDARKEALDIGITTAIRWLNPTSITPASEEGG